MKNKQQNKEKTNIWKKYRRNHEIKWAKHVNKKKSFEHPILPTIIYEYESWALTKLQKFKQKNCQKAMERKTEGIRKQNCMKQKQWNEPQNLQISKANGAQPSLNGTPEIVNKIKDVNK